MATLDMSASVHTDALHQLTRTVYMYIVCTSQPLTMSSFNITFITGAKVTKTNNNYMYIQGKTLGMESI